MRHIIFIILMAVSTYVMGETCPGAPGSMSGLAANNVASTPSSVSLTWSHTGSTGTGWTLWSYQVWYKLSTSTNYTDSGVSTVGHSGTVNGLTPGATYDFQVIGKRTCGLDGSSQSQTKASFLDGVLLKPAKPNLLPATNIGPSSFTANWTTTGLFSQLLFDVSLNSVFSSFVYNGVPAFGTSILVGSLSPNTTYFYRVRASNAAGPSLNSSTGQVKTDLAAPVLVAPDSVASDSFIAKWLAAPGAQEYWVDVATDAGFTSFATGYNGKIATGTSLAVIGLSPQTIYYYRVRTSSASDGSSDYSLVAQVSTTVSSFGGDTPDPFLVNVIPPSPEASALAKYADIPVSLYSGTPSISIPIYTLKERGLTLPISLNYHGGGHTVETVAPRTGLGWTLDAGGVVTRSVRGWPDEHARGFLAVARQYQEINGITALSNDDKYPIYDELAFGCQDAEPDLFYFNFSGYSGKFMFDWDGTITMLSPNSIKVEPVGLTTTSGDFIDGWKITVDDGTVFTFLVQETTRVDEGYTGGDVCQFLNEINSVHMPQSWYLSEIRSVNQDSWIHFDYDSYVQQNEIWVMETKIHSAKFGPGDSKQQKLKVTNQGRNLRRITVSSGQVTVDFLASGEARTDVSSNIDTHPPDNYPLEQINVTNVNGRQVDHWDFAYDYTTNRLTLNSLMESVGGAAKPPYEFLYNGGLPKPLSFSRDHWGFANGKPNSTLVPATVAFSYLFPNGIVFSGADRSPSSTAVLAGMLNQINYPTGGKDSLQFESHDYSYEQRNELINKIYLHRMTDVSVPDDNTAAGQISSDQETFTLIGKSDVKVAVTTSYGYTGFGSGSTYGPSFTITNAAGKVIDGRSPPPNDVTDLYTLYKLPAGTYTIRARVKVPFPGTVWLKNSIKVTLDWDEDTGQTETEIRPGGGVRIGKIVRSFGNGNPDKVSVYSYRKNEGGRIKSTGSLLESAFIYEKYLKYAVETSTIDGLQTEDKFVRFSQNRATLGTTQGSHVGYDFVTVLHGEKSENGRSEYSFDSPRQVQDGVEFDVPFPPPLSNDHARGLLLRQADFAAASNDTLRSVINSYNFVEKDIAALKMGWKVTGYNARGPLVVNDLYAVGAYVTRHGYGRLVSTRERILKSGVPAVETRTSYSYNETTHKQLISSSTKNSKGETIVNSFKYPLDYTSPVSGVQAMRDRHVDNVPVEKLSWIAGTGTQTNLLSAIRTDFSVINNYLVATTKLGAKITTPISTTDPFGTAKNIYEQRLLLSKYDNFSNLREHSNPGGAKSSYQWGYAGTLPIAKADNAAYNQIFFESFEEDATATIDQQRTGLKSKFINGKYTIPTNGRPGVNGNYVFSYWIKIGGASWTYVEKSLTNYTVGTTIQSDTFNGYIDDVRIYPVGSLLTTYTYEPLVGMTSITDPANVTIYFEYDDMGRLINTLDQDRNIVKNYDYQYQVSIPFTAPK